MKNRTHLFIIFLCAIIGVIFFASGERAKINAQTSAVCPNGPPASCAIDYQHKLCSNTTPIIPGCCPVPSGWGGDYNPPVTTVTPTPAVCGGNCNGLTQCPIECPSCVANSIGTSTCQGAPTATPTPQPACGVACDNVFACQGAKDGCTACIAGTCQHPPSPTPTNTPAPSATPTSTPVPSATPTSTPIPTATSTPAPTSTPVPTATPTPPFDESMCSCDGLQPTSSIGINTPLNVTAYGKVLGINKNFAKIPTITFTFWQSPPNSTQVKNLKTETVNTTVIEDTADKVRYQALWVYNLPSNLDTSQTYRIQAHIDCSRKSAAANFTTNTVVLGTSTKQPGFFDKIALFFASLFGLNQQSSISQTVIPTATPTLTQQQKNIQLGTFVPARGIEQDNCTFIKFHF